MALIRCNKTADTKVDFFSFVTPSSMSGINAAGNSYTSADSITSFTGEFITATGGTITITKACHIKGRTWASGATSGTNIDADYNVNDTITYSGNYVVLKAYAK